MPLNREAVLVAVATVGTTLAPWGLAFIQSYAVDKRLQVKDLRYERVDVIVGAVLTGVIGFFVVVACAATLHVAGHRGQRRPRRGAGARAARRQRRRDPLRPRLPRRRAARGGDRPALHRLLGLRDPRPPRRPRRQLRARRGPSTSASAPSSLVAAGLVLIPGAPLIPILFLTQALNAVLLLVLLPFIRSLGQGPRADGRARARARRPLADRASPSAVIAASVLALGRPRPGLTASSDAEQRSSARASARRPTTIPALGPQARRARVGLRQHLDRDQGQHRPGGEGEGERQQAARSARPRGRRSGRRPAAERWSRPRPRTGAPGRTRPPPSGSRRWSPRECSGSRSRGSRTGSGPARSEAKAVPTAKPSGRLWTKRTRKTRAEVRAPGPLRPMKRGVGRRSRRRATPSRAGADARPPSTADAEPFFGRRDQQAGDRGDRPSPRRRSPSRNGVSCAARSPRKKTGTAPSPVARAVPQAASRRTTTSGIDET